ncbi:hypothetical protein LY78DRAFT_651948, partial [Colletotrichum sublineola]
MVVVSARRNALPATHLSQQAATTPREKTQDLAVIEAPESRPPTGRVAAAFPAAVPSFVLLPLVPAYTHS